MGKLDLTILSMMFVSFLSNSAYALIAPFLPFLFAEKGIELSLMGYIFSTYSVAVIICSPFVGKMLSKLGRRRFIQIGLFTMGLSMLAFAFISYIDSSRTTFISLAFVIRFF
jgi:MFS family permease